MIKMFGLKGKKSIKKCFASTAIAKFQYKLSQ